MATPISSTGRRSDERSLLLAWLKWAVATPVCILGLLMGNGLRIIYSEVLGWLAQLVPPSLYQLEEEDSGPRQDS